MGKHAEDEWYFDPLPPDDELIPLIKLGTVIKFKHGREKVKRDRLLVISDPDGLATRVDRRNVVGLVYVDGEVATVRLSPTAAAAAGWWGIDEISHTLFRKVAPEHVVKMVKRASRSRRRIVPW